MNRLSVEILAWSDVAAGEVWRGGGGGGAGSRPPSGPGTGEKLRSRRSSASPGEKRLFFLPCFVRACSNSV